MPTLHAYGPPSRLRQFAENLPGEVTVLGSTPAHADLDIPDDLVEQVTSLAASFGVRMRPTREM